jgi:hypothetical protein
VEQCGGAGVGEGFVPLDGVGQIGPAQQAQGAQPCGRVVVALVRLRYAECHERLVEDGCGADELGLAGEDPAGREDLRRGRGHLHGGADAAGFGVDLRVDRGYQSGGVLGGDGGDVPDVR